MRLHRRYQCRSAHEATDSQSKLFLSAYPHFQHLLLAPSLSVFDLAPIMWACVSFFLYVYFVCTLAYPPFLTISSFHLWLTKDVTSVMLCCRPGNTNNDFLKSVQLFTFLLLPRRGYKLIFPLLFNFIKQLVRCE